MAMKKTQLERLNAARLQDNLRKSAPPDRYAQGAHALSRREQRERDRGDKPLNEVVAELLERGLGA